MKHRMISNGSLLGCVIIILFFGLLLNATASTQNPDERPSFAGKAWKGDFKAMVERQHIRALVVYSKTFYFLDKAQQKGLTYDGLMQFEKYINERIRIS